MGKKEETRKKRSQRDYSMSFKLSVIDEIEKGDLTYQQAQDLYGIQGKSTVLVWLRKYGNLDWKYPKSSPLSKMHKEETPAQKIKRLEKELENERLKNEMLNYMIDLSDKQYGTAIRKKFSPKQSGSSSDKKE
jgi:transposase-like protein